ncbi:hypothetical protein NKH77_19570 [Streptomyces sp. M19]
MAAVCTGGYLVLWAAGALGILALSQWVRAETPVPKGTVTLRGVSHFQPVDAAHHVWRGSAPSPRATGSWPHGTSPPWSTCAPRTSPRASSPCRNGPG